MILTDKYKVTGKFMVLGHEFDDFETTSVRFLGCTLWTENLCSWIRYRHIKSLKNYKQLESSGYENFRLQLSEFSPSDAKQIFEESVGWLDYKLKQTPDIPTVVVTHHAPSYRSNIMPNGDKYISDFDPDLQSAYMNNLDDFILEHQSNLKLWIHGHLHSSADYMIGNTQIICNPRGRGSAEEKNSTLILA